jgi:hypothetical protein
VTPALARWRVAVTVALAACGPTGEGTATAMSDVVGGFAPGTPEGLPARAPARFGFGAEASAARVGLWDLDVKPDGEGLPPWSGRLGRRH